MTEETKLPDTKIVNVLNGVLYIESAGSTWVYYFGQVPGAFTPEDFTADQNNVIREWCAGFGEVWDGPGITDIIDYDVEKWWVTDESASGDRTHTRIGDQAPGSDTTVVARDHVAEFNARREGLRNALNLRDKSVWNLAKFFLDEWKRIISLEHGEALSAHDPMINRQSHRLGFKVVL